MDRKPMLNLYPDSFGGTLKEVCDVLELPHFSDVFSSLYILPSMFNTDLDRGFSVIDYNLNQEMATTDDLDRVKALGIDLKLDFILNHASVLSPQFRDLVAKGQASKYADFFINWNKFWDGHGEMTEEGYIKPYPELIKQMFFRKPGLPLLMVKMPDGTSVPYWNTFYQKISYRTVDPQDLMRLADLQYQTANILSDSINKQLAEGVSPKQLDLGDLPSKAIVDWLESDVKYLGQMDLNVKSPLVWDFYDDTLHKFRDYGAKVVRLDAFAYGSKEIGKPNFLNDPETFAILQRVKELAEQYQVTLLPEIHASYGEKIHELLCEKGYMTYDFFLPGLIIHAFEAQTGDNLVRWANEIIDQQLKVVNMLGCHDGIPLLDLKGFLGEEQIQSLIDTVVARGGYVKNLHGQKNMYYQVNATYYSALGEDDQKMLLARAIQLFMPAKPQVWYLDLFVGKNDHDAVVRAGKDGHKEINRTNLTVAEIQEKLSLDVVQKQLDLLRFRNTDPVFDGICQCQTTTDGLSIRWEKDGRTVTLTANLKDYSFTIV